jgi:hypothetical protein
MTQQAAPGTDYPGKTLGIVGVILAILVPLVGLILSIVARNQSNKAGFKNTPATAGIIIGAIFVVLGVIFSIVWFSVIAAAVNSGAYVG